MSAESIGPDRISLTRNNLTECNYKIKDQKAKTTKTLWEKDAAFAKISQEEWFLLKSVGTAVKFSIDLAQRHIQYIEAKKI